MQHARPLRQLRAPGSQSAHPVVEKPQQVRRAKTIRGVILLAHVYYDRQTAGFCEVKLPPQGVALQRALMSHLDPVIVESDLADSDYLPGARETLQCRDLALP